MVGGVRFSIRSFGEAVFVIMFGLVVWRGLFFPFSLGCWFAVWRGRLFHLVRVGSLEGPLFNLVWVAGLDGPLVSFSFFWLRGGAVFSIWFGWVVWRGPFFHVWVAGLVGLVVWRGIFPN